MQNNNILLRISIFLLFLGLMLKKCSAKDKPLIMNGEDASIEDYPHSAYLLTTLHRKEDGVEIQGSLCGASIFNQDILLTAAHCVHIMLDKNYTTKFDVRVTATVGHTNITGREKHCVSLIKIHESYDYTDPFTYPGDIALLKLKYPLKFSETVKRITIMKSPPYFEPASVAGWGVVDLVQESVIRKVQRIHTEILQHLTNLKVWSREECMQQFEFELNRHDPLPKGTFCAGHDDMRNGTVYTGDSGSALVVRDYIQTGIVASHRLLAVTRMHIVYVYTDVGYFYDWILKNVMELYCEKNTAIVL